VSVPSSEPSAAIEVKGLTKSYGIRWALRGVDLNVDRGQVVALFGPNGAGKTTLIKVLSSIIRPTAGKVRVEGHDLKSDADEARSRIGIVTHSTFLYNHFTAFENLDFYGRIYGVSDRHARIREVADQVEMAPRLHDRVGSLSRGMQQRVSIARALLHRPSVMLLDEPETGLDQRSTSIIWSALLGTGAEKRTVVLTTHSLERGLELSDRVVILNRGKVAYECTTSSLDLACLREAYDSTTGAKG
jgi:heme exporter protein A